MGRRTSGTACLTTFATLAGERRRSQVCGWRSFGGGEVGGGWRRGLFRGKRGWALGTCPVRMQDGGQTEDRGWTTEDGGQTTEDGGTEARGRRAQAEERGFAWEQPGPPCEPSAHPPARTRFTQVLTALDRDAPCWKHRLYQKLKQMDHQPRIHPQLRVAEPVRRGVPSAKLASCRVGRLTLRSQVSVSG